jgi:formylglycine-generating enzyme required for sulfatase activity
LLAIVTLAACGRLSFDPIASAPGDGATGSDGDAATGDAGLDLAPLVPGGSFYQAFDMAADAAFPNMIYPATVSDFRLDRYVVTVARFRAFVNAGFGTQASPPANGSGAHANLAGSGWNSTWNPILPADTAALAAAVSCDPTYQMWTSSPGANEAQPMNCLNWYVAMAFCIWDGGYLPTEPEIGYAQAGGAEQRAYPWSNPPPDLTIDATYASFYIDDLTQCCGDGSPGCGATDIVAVGTHPAGDGRWGHADLGGNVAEWVLDYGQAGYVVPCNDCAYLTPTSTRVVRGGSFHITRMNLRSGQGQTQDPGGYAFDTGVRCARAP